MTTVPRTILDLAATEDADTVENLLRESEFRQPSDRLSLPDLIARYPGKRGTRKVQVALDRLKEDPHGRRRSRLEERFAPFLRQTHLPLPRFNDWIELDRARDRRLTATGYTVTHLTWTQLDDEPAEIASDLRSLLLG